MNNKYGHLNLPSGSLRIAVTNKCNMNCFYCHNEGQPKTFQKDMTFEDYVDIINVAKNFGLRTICFTGGEPFVNKDFEKMVRYTIDNKLGRVEICSNGILIREYVDLLKISNDISVSIGIDTCRKDKISKQSSIGKTFGFIEENLFLMKNNSIKFYINTVFTQNNEQEIEEIIDYCSANNIVLKVIEADTMEYNPEKTKGFVDFADKTILRLNLKKSVVYPVNNIYCTNGSGWETYFYPSKCHERKCDECKNWTLRINSLGEATPCYVRNDRYKILSGEKDQWNNNFLKSIYNLGISPEKNTVDW